MELFELVKALNEGFGPSGQEGGVAEVIRALARPYADDISADVMGNLIVHKRGNGPRLMLAAHMDAIGFMVTHIQDNGLVRVGGLGGVSPGTAAGTPVRFLNGVRGVVQEDSDLGDKKREVGHLFIDIGAKDGAEAGERVKVGDAAIFDTPLFESGGAIMGPYLDDRIGCAVLLKTLERAKESGNDLYFVFTVQEEVGVRGAQTAAYGVDPDYGVAVDVTHGDEKAVGSSKLGGGAAIKVMDRSVICHPQMVERLRGLAQRDGTAFQMDVITAGGTDAGAIHKSRAGVVTGGVSIPCRYAHSPVAAVCTADAEACVCLLTALVHETLPALETERV